VTIRAIVSPAGRPARAGAPNRRPAASVDGADARIHPVVWVVESVTEAV
jgi:hypothetical protein